MKVLKFGGTSVGSVESLQSLTKIVQQSFLNNDHPIVVTSAMSGITNLLTQMAENAADQKAFDLDIKSIETSHFDIVKSLISIQNQNPVFTKLKLMLNELEDVLQGIFALKELSLQSKDLVLSYGEKFSTFMFAKIL